MTDENQTFPRFRASAPPRKEPPSRNLLLSSETSEIIAAAIDVHKALGPGFLESIYENALVIELGARGRKVETQVPVSIKYRGSVVGFYRLDMIVDSAIVVELKTVSVINDSHVAVVASYLRAVGLKVGLILNFADSTLRVRRVVWSDRTSAEERKRGDAER